MRISLEPVHDNPNGVKTEELTISRQDYEDLQVNSPADDLMRISDLSGAPGASAGEVTIPPELMETLRRKQQG